MKKNKTSQGCCSSSQADKNKRRLAFFAALKTLTKSQRKKFLATCSDNNLHTICGACFNINKNVIPVNKKTKKYKQVEKQLARLANPKLSIKSKRKLLMKDQVGHGVLGLLASTVLPFLTSLIGG